MSDIEQVENLKHTFSSKPEAGSKLPNPKDVADKASFYLKSGANYTKHRMIGGSWYKEIVSGTEVILQKVG